MQNHKIKIRFQHCDPAGIVFYPRYFEMLNETVEDWFETLGMPFATMHGPAQVGVPTAHIDIDFHAPSRLGEVLEFQLAARRIGGASLDLSIVAGCGGQKRLTAQLTLVFISMGDGRPRPWPDDLRRAIEQQLQPLDMPDA